MLGLGFACSAAPCRVLRYRSCREFFRAVAVAVLRAVAVAVAVRHGRKPFCDTSATTLVARQALSPPHASASAARRAVAEVSETPVPIGHRFANAAGRFAKPVCALGGVGGSPHASASAARRAVAEVLRCRCRAVALLGLKGSVISAGLCCCRCRAVALRLRGCASLAAVLRKCSYKTCFCSCHRIKALRLPYGGCRCKASLAKWSAGVGAPRAPLRGR